MSQPIELSRIEVVMHLQHVELFNFCSTEEVLRIASIVEPEAMAEGSVIYQANQRSKKLYCVISGQVLLSSEDGTEATVERNGAFGVLDILSGRLRTHEARALEPTTTLAIEAEDFFDLLSNNIEIVKGLFREVLRAGGVAEGRSAPVTGGAVTELPSGGSVAEADSNVVPLQRRAVF
jgi:CRP-like cAMP-binding protein